MRCWGEKTYPFRSSFLDTIHTYYGGVVMPVDFRSAAEAARQQINEWVEQQTNKRIKDLMGPGSVSPATRLVITNAVYFKGEWLKPFEASSTRPKDFHLADGKTVSTPMMTEYMYDSTGYGAFKGDGTVFDTPHEIPVEMPDNDPSLYPDAHGFTALRLPYKGGKLCMVLIVPQSADGLGALEKMLPTNGPATLDRRHRRSDGDRQRPQVQAPDRVFAERAAPSAGHGAGIQRSGPRPQWRSVRPHDGEQ